MHAVATQPKPAAGAQRLRGFIKNIQVTHGYCFVRGDNGSSYFLHELELQGGSKQMVKGALVEFTPMPVNIPGKADRATKAVVISKPEPRKQLL